MFKSVAGKYNRLSDGNIAQLYNTPSLNLKLYIYSDDTLLLSI